MLLTASVPAPLHTTCSSRQSVLFRRGGQAVSFKGFSKDNTVFVGKQVVGTKATGVCVVFYVAAKYSSIFLLEPVDLKRPGQINCAKAGMNPQGFFLTVTFIV